MNDRADAQDGQLQTSFGTGGHALTGLGSSTFDRNDAGNAVVEQADGKILVGNTYARGFLTPHKRWAMMRYMPNGQPDVTFGVGGVKRVAFGDTTDNEVSSDLALDEGLQRIYQCGSGRTQAADSNGFCVVAFHMDGSVDPSFGVDGLAFVSPSGLNSTATSMVVQADGRIVVGGSEGEGDLVIVRFDADGTLDNTFATDGVFTYSGSEANWEEVSSLLVDPVSQFIYAGVTTNHEGPGSQMQVFRLATAGQLDTAWDGDGISTLPFFWGGYLTDMALWPDGRLLTVGSTNNMVGLARSLQDGSLDTSFCGAGYTVIGLIFETTLCRTIAIQADCKMVLAGAVGDAAEFGVTDPRPFVWRLLPTSEGDATFATASIFIDSIPEADQGRGDVTGLLIHSDQRIIYCGTAKAVGGDVLDDDHFVAALTSSASGECPPSVNIGVDERIEAAIALYPVPSSGHVTITSIEPIRQLLVRDATGRTVFIRTPNSSQAELELNTPGVYFVDIISGTATLTKRVVICE
jgi:uncharacterized delta-60 repeat protein